MLRFLLVTTAIATLLGGCVHPKVAFHKAKLLDPMMDPAKTDGLHTAFRAEPQQWNERGGGEVGGALGGSCPTCGG